MKTLESLRSLSVRAHNGTSFSPEKRGDSTVNGYSEEIDDDIALIRSKGASDEQVERYKKGYIEKLSAYLNSRSNIVSTMIAGPSNFPVRRMEKRNRWADNHYENFRQWRKKVLRAYDRYEKNRKIEAAGGPLGAAKAKLAELESTQEYMKRINRIHAAYKKNPASLDKQKDLSEKEIEAIKNYVPQYSWVPHPFAPYQLTNNNAMIKNTKDRIAELEAKEALSTKGNKEFQFPGGVCELNYDLDRVTIKHDQKPERDIIDSLKSSGFRWSPHYGVWMRKLTGNAIFATSHLLKMEINP